ncbi:MAG: hypothetical protein JSU74_07855 [Candidatus Zixiibacteriota bacterium]|nr:MAG: hypothetical protein JSU74_07855 [candidate division Zixibacteria bacterium]
MRLRTLLVISAVFVLAASVTANASDSEEEFVNRYLKKIEKKHTKKLTWISGYFAVNRINRENDYNRFATAETMNFTDATIPWLGEAKMFGLDFGLIFSRRFAWSLSAEYWLKIGSTLEGSYYYEPTGAYIENPSSEVSLYGASTGLQYYFYNPPTLSGELNGVALRAGAGVGFYKAQWEVWQDYQNLNLATSLTEATDAKFGDQAIGFSFGFGADFPTRVWNLVLGLDFQYLYLNFDNVAWYNDWDQEIIATYTGDSEGRVDLGLSGFKGKVELKHFFSW